MSVPKLLSCQQAAGSANRMQRKEVEREMSARKNDVQTKSRQQEGLSRFKDDKRKPNQETVASSGRQRCREQGNVKDKDFQEITESTAGPARRSGADPVRSPLSL